MFNGLRRVAGSLPSEVGTEHELLLHAPTDDRPFFRNFLRQRGDELPSKKADPFEFMRLWDDALALMYLLIFVVSSFAIAFLLGPLLRPSVAARGPRPPGHTASVHARLHALLRVLGI
jgi:hypothetical protein